MKVGEDQVGDIAVPAAVGEGGGGVPESREQRTVRCPSNRPRGPLEELGELVDAGPLRRVAVGGLAEEIDEGGR